MSVGLLKKIKIYVIYPVVYKFKAPDLERMQVKSTNISCASKCNAGEPRLMCVSWIYMITHGVSDTVYKDSFYDVFLN